MLAYANMVAQLFVSFVQLVQIVLVWIIARQIGAKFDIHVWKNGDKPKEVK